MVKDISSLANIYRSFFEYLIVILEGLFIDKDTISNFTTKFEQLFEENPNATMSSPISRLPALILIISLWKAATDILASGRPIN